MIPPGRWRCRRHVPHRYQLYHDESREGCNEEHIELKLRILEQLFDLEFDDGCIEQGEINTRQEAEEGTDVFQRRRMEKRGTTVMCREPSCSCSGHRIVETVEEIHSCHVVGCDAGNGEHQIDTPYPFSRSGKPWMQFRFDRSCCLGSKHLGLSSYKRWQQGDGEEHDSQTAYPLGERTLEKQSVWEAFYIV